MKNLKNKLIDISTKGGKSQIIFGMAFFEGLPNKKRLFIKFKHYFIRFRT